MDHFLRHYLFFALRPGQADTLTSDSYTVFDAKGNAAETLPKGDFSVTVSTKWGYTAATNIAVAVYNESGKPIGIRLLPVTGNNVTAELTGLTDAKYLKVFALSQNVSPVKKK